MGIFGNLFGRELEELNEKIRKWERVLTPDYAYEWNNWLHKMDVVSEKLRLSEVEVAKLTLREVAKYASFSLRRQIGVGKIDIDTIAGTRGNTTAIQAMRLASREFNKYNAICRRFVSLKKFDSLIEKAGRGR